MAPPNNTSEIPPPGPETQTPTHTLPQKAVMAVVRMALESVIGKPFTYRRVRAFLMDPEYLKKVKGNLTLANTQHRNEEYAKEYAAQQNGQTYSQNTLHESQYRILEADSDGMNSVIKNILTEFIVNRADLLNTLTAQYSLEGAERELVIDLIDTLSDAEVIEMTRHGNAGKRNAMIQEKIGELLSHPFQVPNIEKVFTENTSYQTVPDFAEVKKILKQEQTFLDLWVVPSESVFETLLEKGKNLNADTKVKILEHLGVTLDLQKARDLSLIEDSAVNGIFQNIFGKVYDSLQGNEKWNFVNYTLLSKKIHIPMSAIDRWKLDWSNPALRSYLAERIQTSLRETSATEPPRANTTLGSITKIYNEEREKGNVTFSYHDAFLKYAKRTHKAEPNTPAFIENIETFTPWNLLELKDSEKNTIFLKIHPHIDEHGVAHTEKFFQEGWVWVTVETLVLDTHHTLRSNGRMEVAYEDLLRFFHSHRTAKIIPESSLDNRLTWNQEEKWKVWPNSPLSQVLDLRDETRVSLDDLASHLDTYDTNGKKYGFTVGTYFETIFQEENTTDHETWKVHAIDRANNTVDIMNSVWGIQKDVGLENILAMAKSPEYGFKRVDLIAEADPKPFLDRLIHDHTAPASITLTDTGRLIQKIRDEKTGQEKELELRRFQNANTHIMVNHVKDGIVHYQGYKGKTTNKKTWKEEDLGYDPVKTLSYWQFLKFLTKEKLKAKVEEHHDTDILHNKKVNTKGSFIKKFLQMQSYASMKLGIKTIFKWVKELLENNSKLDGSRFALSLARKLNLPEVVTARIFADIVRGSKEIIDKEKGTLSGLPWPKARWRCIEIAQNLDSRPEEVLAAIMFLVENYWLLYAEDVGIHQSIVTKDLIEHWKPWSLMFFDSLVITTRMGDLREMRQRAYKKAKTELIDSKDNESHLYEPTEEHMIHMILKDFDSASDKYPHASSVKAVWGASTFKSIWKESGWNKAKEKANRDVVMDSIAWRVAKWVGFLKSRELGSAVGAMDQIQEKDQNPEYQVVPFIWALGGFSRFLSGEQLQQLKNFWQTRFTFHAFWYLRNGQANEAYRNCVIEAVRTLAEKRHPWDPEKAKKYVDTFTRFVNNLNADSNNKREEAIEGLAEFWKKEYRTYGGQLHRMLQGMDWWLSGRDDPVVARYKRATNAGFAEKDTDMTDHNTWYVEYGWTNSVAATYTTDGLRSIRSNLRNIKPSGNDATDISFVSFNMERMWYPLFPMINSYRDIDSFNGDRQKQKAQYLLFRKEIIARFQGVLKTRIKEYADVDKKKFYNRAEIAQTGSQYSIASLWIDPRVLFDETLEVRNEESDFQNWINSRPARVTTDDISASITGEVEHILGLKWKAA